MAPPFLEIRNLAKRFPTRQGREPSPWVIRDLSFAVGEGEFVTLIGPSGSGKTTLLNMIAQIDVANDGQILFSGDAIAVSDPKSLRPGLDRRVGYVTQDDNLLPWRTTIDNVLFPLEVQGRLDDKTRGRRWVVRGTRRGLAAAQGFDFEEAGIGNETADDAALQSARQFRERLAVAGEVVG